MPSHKFIRQKAYPFFYCEKCGVVSLKNHASQKSVNSQCREYHEGVWDMQYWDPKKKKWMKFT